MRTWVHRPLGRWLVAACAVLGATRAAAEAATTTTAPTAMTASATPSSATYGTTIVLAATGLARGATGVVTFSAGNETVCVALVSAGSASCTTPAVPTGTYDVTASYGGDDQDPPASAATTFTITAPAPSTTNPDPDPSPDPTTTTTVAPAPNFVAPPSIQIVRPVNAARYVRHSTVKASYSCEDGSGAPGLTSCQGSVATGARIDTTATGRHAFTVTGVSGSGESTARTLYYTVYMPSNRIAIAQPRLSTNGTGSVRVVTPGPGRLTAVETGWPNARHAPALAHQTVLARGATTVRATDGAPATVSVRPGSAGRRLLADAGVSWLRVRLAITFAPVDGTARTQVRYGLLHLR